MLPENTERSTQLTHPCLPFLSLPDLSTKMRSATIPRLRPQFKSNGTNITKREHGILLSVREYDDVKREAQANNVHCHFGYLHALCHEKHSELLPEQRICKGRVVFLGNQVKDEHNLNAVFSEQSSSTCLVTGIKTLDAVARLPGRSGENRDAEQAYIQANLGGPPTLVSLPPDQWPQSWRNKFRRPVVRLKLALYGHPLARLYWEQKTHDCIKKCGLEPVPDWECIFNNTKLQLMLGIYVDDVKLVGKSSNLDEGWRHVEQHIAFGARTPFSEFLGSKQRDIALPADLLDSAQLIIDVDGPPAAGRQLNGIDATSAPAHDKQTAPPHAAALQRPTMLGCAPRSWEYSMTGFAEQCIDKCCDLANT